MAPDYDQNEQIKLLNLAFDQVRARIQSGELGPRAMKETIIQLAILIDKRKQLDSTRYPRSASPSDARASNITAELKALEAELADKYSDDVPA